jgi:nucleotide-binding universal stress UspA family protein
VLAYVRVLTARTDGKLKLIRATEVEDGTSFNSLEQNARRLQDAGFAVEWSIMRGVDAETAILTAEAEWRPDLIALSSLKASRFDRWLNGSVTEHVVKSASAPVLVVPPAWDRPMIHGQSARVLVPVDGSLSAEQAVWAVVRLTRELPTRIMLMRAIPDDARAHGAQEYLSWVAAEAQTALPDAEVTTRLVVDSTVKGILETARNEDVDLIAMSTRGQPARRHALVGRTASDVFARATAPLLLLGPRALVDRQPAQIKLGARVRSVDEQVVGEIHRVVVDLDQQAIVSIVVLGRGSLGRDVLVPADYIRSAGVEEVHLELTREALDNSPDFAYNELVTPPAAWTSATPSLDEIAWAPGRQHKRLAPAQRDLTRGTEVVALDGTLGNVDRVEWDPTASRLIAFWVHTSGIFGQLKRIRAEWVQRTDEHGNLQLAMTRTDIDGYLGDAG